MFFLYVLIRLILKCYSSSQSLLKIKLTETIYVHLHFIFATFMW